MSKAATSISTLPESLTKRLVTGKYLISRTGEELARKQYYSPGLAILTLQDGTEMILRVIAEHLEATIKPKTSFDQIILGIDEACEKASPKRPKITHRTALNRMNSARVNFKHYANLPLADDVRDFLHDVEVFASTAVQVYLETDYSEISLTSLIEHRRTRNWLDRANESMDLGKYKESVFASAGALKIYRGHVGAYSGSRGFRNDHYLNLLPNGDQRWPEAVRERLQEIDTTLEKHQEILYLLEAGISLKDYRRFTRLTPIVNFAASGKYDWIQLRTDPLTREDAVFCHRFALDAMLAMKATIEPKDLEEIADHAPGSFTITNDCELLEWPEEGAYVFRSAEANEILNKGDSWDTNGFVSIEEAGETAWVKETFVSRD